MPQATLHVLRGAILIALISLAQSAFALTGVWSGTLRGQDGSEAPITYQFNPSGHPMLGFVARTGPRAIELRHVGQQVQWLLPGSGYAEGRVEALYVTSSHVQAVVSIQSVSGGGSLRDESRRRLTFDWRLAGAALQTTVVVEARNHNVGNGIGLYAESWRRNVLQGVLRQQ